jgi:hypothetical protein
VRPKEVQQRLGTGGQTMSREKQIEEMARDLCYNGGTCSLEEWNDCKLKVGEYCSKCKSIAERLINAGYRKQSENTVELPCKVGDILYVITQMKDKRILPFINEYEVTSISIKKKSIVVYHEMDGFIKNFRQCDFGKTIFLTREEAERAVTDINVGSK